MSKTFQMVCVVLLGLILATQLVNLFVSTRPKIAALPMTARANLASDGTSYDNCWMFWGTNYCNPYANYSSGRGYGSNLSNKYSPNNLSNNYSPNKLSGHGEPSFDGGVNLDPDAKLGGMEYR